MAKQAKKRPSRQAGQTAEAANKTLRSYAVGAMPIVNHLLRRLNLEAILERRLPAEDDRMKVPTAAGVLLLVRNVLMSREPIYGVADWAYGFAPDLLDLSEEQLEREATGDGLFPLLTNQRQMSAEDVLRAYKRQPLIEKRFSQFKTDFAVAPVYLKDVSRIQGLLCVYFLALLVQTLLERDVRQAMQRAGIDHLPLYAEDRECRRPTARKLIDLFDPIQRHVLTTSSAKAETLPTKLSPLQQKILQLLNIPQSPYGR